MVSTQTQVVPPGVSEETRVVTQIWNPSIDDAMPSWWVWTGGWYELDGENNYYTKWDCLNEPSVVMDIGSYEGEWSRRIADTYHPTIHLFEPAEKAYGVSVERMAGYDNVHIWNFGLGSKCGVFRLYDASRDGATFYKAEGSYIDARIKNISRWMIEEDIHHVDLMSLNTEGAEFEILPYLIGTGEIELFDRMMIQWHHIFDNAAALQRMIQEAMSRTHRMLWNLGAWEAWARKGLS